MSSRRVLLYKVKSRINSEGDTVYSVFSCLDDIEHHRHRRNPFDPKYVQAALSSFEAIDISRAATRSEVEAASTSVHVRVELIKSMKDGLTKLTTEAVKHCKGAVKRPERKKVQDLENKNKKSCEQACEEEPLETNFNTFLCKDDYDIFVGKFKNYYKSRQFQSKREYGTISCIASESFPKPTDISLGLDKIAETLQQESAQYPHVLENEELCFNLDKEVIESLQDVIQRLWPNGYLETPTTKCDGDTLADISCFKKYILPVTKELTIDGEDWDLEAESDFMKEENKEFSEAFIKNCDTEADSDVNCEVTGVSEETNDDDDINVEEEKNGINSERRIFDEENAEVCNVQMEINLTIHQEKTLFVEAYSEESKVQTESNGIECEEGRPSNVEDSDNYEMEAEIEISNGEGRTKLKGISNKDCYTDAENDFIKEETARFSNEAYNGFESDRKFGKRPSGTVEKLYLRSVDIEKFIHASRNMRRKKSTWFVQDFKQLLLPFNDDQNLCEDHNFFDEMESYPLPSIVAGQSMFRTALSRPCLDLIEYANLLKEDPYKIPGTLLFDVLHQDYKGFGDDSLSEGNEPALKRTMDKPGVVPEEILIPEANRNRNVLAENEMNSWKESKGAPSTVTHAEESKDVRYQHIRSQRDVWDEIPWTTGKANEAIKAREGDARCIERRNDKEPPEKPLFSGIPPLIPTNSASDVDVGESNNHQKKVDIPITETGVTQCSSVFNNEELHSSQIHSQMRHSDNRNPGEAEELAKCEKQSLNQKIIRVDHRTGDSVMDNCESEHEKSNHSDVESKSQSSEKQITSLHEKDKTSESNKEGFLPSASLASDATQCSLLLSKEESQPLLMHSQLRNSVSMMPGVAEEAMNCEKPSFSQKQFRLDDLIADAVMAEFESQHGKSSHYDLEPLSQSLAKQITFLHQKDKITEISFKSLTEGLHDEIHKNISVHRLFLALLNLAHQQNIGSFKEINSGFQVYLKAGSCNYLPDMAISLTPSKKDAKNHT